VCGQPLPALHRDIAVAIRLPIRLRAKFESLDSGLLDGGGARRPAGEPSAVVAASRDKSRLGPSGDLVI
jgi:hypothetical protein